MMLCLLFVPLVIYLVYYSFIEQSEIRKVKRNGISANGIIIENRESRSKSIYRLGGNINYPTIKFLTVDGKEIIGEPIAGFISQQQVVVQSNIHLMYDLDNPERFCIISG
jgi:hypothetical protein